MTEDELAGAALAAGDRHGSSPRTPGGASAPIVGHRAPTSSPKASYAP